MVWMEQGLYLRVEVLPGGPRPLPHLRGFSLTTAYRAADYFNPSETSDAYFILSNERDEIWFICNRHLRTVVVPGAHIAFRLPLSFFGEQTLTDTVPALGPGFSD